MGKAIGESSIGTRLEKVPICECLFVHREKGPISSVYVDDVKLAGKKQNIDPMWSDLQGYCGILQKYAGAMEKLPETKVTGQGGRTGLLTRGTIRPEINSNDFGWFLELCSRFEFGFRRCGNFCFFERFEFFGVFELLSHTMWLYMCLCCGLFAPTQFHFECCGVLDDS